jgi:hypothetical protein
MKINERFLIIWRKEYKPLLSFVALVGTNLILLVGLKIDVMISTIVLWITAVIIFWYSMETYDLKEVTRKSLEYERAPFVILNYEKDTKKFHFKNVGRGIAKNASMENVVLPDGPDCLLAAPQKTIIEPSGGFTKFTLKYNSPMAEVMGNTNDGDMRMQLLLEKQKSVFITINYEDLTGKRYFTKIKYTDLDDSNEIVEYGPRK